MCIYQPEGPESLCHYLATNYYNGQHSTCTHLILELSLTIFQHHMPDKSTYERQRLYPLGTPPHKMQYMLDLGTPKPRRMVYLIECSQNSNFLCNKKFVPRIYSWFVQLCPKTCTCQILVCFIGSGMVISHIAYFILLTMIL